MMTMKNVGYIQERERGRRVGRRRKRREHDSLLKAG